LKRGGERGKVAEMDSGILGGSDDPHEANFGKPSERLGDKKKKTTRKEKALDLRNGPKEPLEQEDCGTCLTKPTFLDITVKATNQTNGTRGRDWAIKL